MRPETSGLFFPFSRSRYDHSIYSSASHITIWGGLSRSRWPLGGESSEASSCSGLPGQGHPEETREIKAERRDEHLRPDGAVDEVLGAPVENGGRQRDHRGVVPSPVAIVQEGEEADGGGDEEPGSVEPYASGGDVDVGEVDLGVEGGRGDDGCDASVGCHDEELKESG